MTIITSSGSKIMQGDKEIKGVLNVSIGISTDEITCAVVKIPIESMTSNPDGNGFLIELVDDD